MTVEKPNLGYRWIICALLFGALVILYIDRQILGLLKPMLDDQFARMPPAFGIKSLKWSNTTFGLINSVFLLAYGFSTLIFGWLIDRYGTKIGYSICVGAWSLSAGCTSLVSHIGGFFAARLAVGGSEGGCFPCSIKTVALWFPKRERALATSIFNSGTNVGALVAPAIIPLMALHWGWQSCYLAAGIAGLFWLCFWWSGYNTPDKIKAVTAAELELILSDHDPEIAARKMSWAGLLRYRQSWSFIAGKFLTDPVWWFFLIWLPDYFKNSAFHLDVKKSWPHLMTIYAIVTSLSICGGWVTGWLTSRGWTVTRARKTGMFVFALLVMPITLARYGTPWVAVVLIGLAGAAHQAWSANLFTTVSDMFPKSAVASVTGMGGLAGSISSAIFPYVTGLVLDHFKAQNDVNSGYTLLFVICGLAYIVAFAIHHLLAPKLTPLLLDREPTMISPLK
ncbi:MAG TPA: MFS transporter [Candidatus Acidoferrales bacterium]|nr:MFS transporter [Candidatus Acidoferrales bacterium]